jgi:hypothetical protein
VYKVTKMKLDLFFVQIFIIELGTDCCLQHIVHTVHKQAMNDEKLNFSLNEDSLLAVDCWVADLLHPVLDGRVPSSGSLPSSIDALEELLPSPGADTCFVDYFNKLE